MAREGGGESGSVVERTEIAVEGMRSCMPRLTGLGNLRLL